MNKLEEILNHTPDHDRDNFEKAFRKIFGITPEIDWQKTEGLKFSTYGQTFSIDHENNLLWKRNGHWHAITTLEQARQLWKN